MDINFIIPGLYEHCDLNFRLLGLMRDHPECFRDNVKVSAVYGSFQFSIFDGGRSFTNYRFCNREEIEKIIYQYNEVFNVPVRLICTNNQLEPKHYTDRFNNLIFSLCDNGMNEVTVSDNGLGDYIQEHYPTLKLISSTTKCITNTNQLQNELHDDSYTMVCLDYNLNHHKKFLEGLSEEEKAKCEFLCNAICPTACPSRKKHYQLNSLFSLSYGKPYRLEPCNITDNTLHPTTCISANNISPDEIYDYYVPNGFNLFKLEGRTLSGLENACNYVRYMCKPEWQMWVLSILVPDSSSGKTFANMDHFLKNTR